jgi:hypothetical protein
MSYDITFIRVPEGMSAEAAYEEFLRRDELRAQDLDAWKKRGLPPETRQRMQELMNALKAVWPKFEQFEPASPLPWLEVTDEDTQVQVALYEAGADITTPYFRKDRTQMLDCVRACFHVLKINGGYIAYDPQIGRVIAEEDLYEMARQCAAMDDALPEILAKIPNAVPEKKRSWWKIW